MERAVQHLTSPLRASCRYARQVQSDCDLAVNVYLGLLLRLQLGGPASLEHDSRQSRESFVSPWPLSAHLQEAVKKQQLWRLKDGAGKPPGLLGWWPNRAVSFIDNHDTGSTQNHWPFPSDQVAAGYAYILTHPGGD